MMKLALYVKSFQQAEQPVYYNIWSIVSGIICFCSWWTTHFMFLISNTVMGKYN